MQRAKVWAWVCTIVLFAGCAAPPAEVPVTYQTGTTVILLPDEDGKVGAVTVKTTDDSRLVDQAYQSVSAMKEHTRLSDTLQLDQAGVTTSYAELLKAQPTKPSSFLLYFSAGADLTAESLAAIPRIMDTIKARAPTEVIVVGHTDTTGSDELNTRLARDRAILVEKVLKGRMPSLDRVTVKSFGSKDLLVPTPLNVNEPRNRRVEVVIL